MNGLLTKSNCHGSHFTFGSIVFSLEYSVSSGDDSWYSISVRRASPPTMK